MEFLTWNFKFIPIYLSTHLTCSIPQRLRLSVETYTTRCAILEHNNRLLKDRNSGLENDLISTAAQGNRKKFFVEEESEQEEPDIYNSHVQRKEPRDFRKRLAGCQKEIGKLQDTVAEYQVR